MKTRRKGLIACLFLLSTLASVSAQEIQMSRAASLEAVYGDVQESQEPLPMIDLGMEFGYVLYEAELTTVAEQSVLEVANIRDYAAVYVDSKLIGSMADSKKTLPLGVSIGKHKLQLYVENIGRITYGPEILDNSKGLFGSITLNGTVVENWKMTPLLVKECSVGELSFTEQLGGGVPCFYQGRFTESTPQDTHLDVSGWGMGEVWVNGQYVGSYWEESSQRSIPVPASALVKGENSVVVFELKDKGKRAVRFSSKAIFN